MKKSHILFALIATVSVLVNSCSKDEETFSGSSPSSIRTTISGIVLNENNFPQNGVTVTAYSKTTTTNQYGVFVLENVMVNKERCIVQFSKPGFFNRTHAFIATINSVNYVRIVLMSNAETHTLQASAGGTITLANNASVQFAPNSFVTTSGSSYSGTVRLTVKHLSPDAPNFGFMIPGGDLAGRNLTNEDVSLYTYGMIGVELRGNTYETLQLASGTTAGLTMPIAASQLSAAPATIPLWYFDETTSLWKEEGTATKVGNNYVGTVTHFSWWNCDYQGPRSTVKGKVVDCANFPVPNIVVTIDGNWNTTTNQNGEFTNWVPSGYTFTIQVLVIYNQGWLTQDSQVEIIPVLSPGQIFIVPDLVIPCPTRVMGTIKTCSGENTSAMVSVSDNGSFYSFQFSQDGNFNIPIPSFTPLNLTASNLTHSSVQNILPVAPQTTFNTGNILLCDNINLFPNNFTVTGGNVPNQVYNINTTNAEAVIGDSIGMNSTSIYITGTAAPQYLIENYQILVPDSVPGTFSGGNVYIGMSSPSFGYAMYASSVTITLTQVDIPGGRVKGNYNGTFTVQISGATSPDVNIAGEFDVLRTQ